jgi:hypothetical protein
VSLIVDEHREYLRDAVRVEAFRAAIRRQVRPGDVVVDLGAGTGVLGLLACQAGAARVYAIESSAMVDIARQIARASGFADRIVFVNEYSTLVNLPEPADGLVMDQIGQFGFEAGVCEFMADARRLLKPGAWTVPRSLDLCVAPITDPDVRERIAFWERPLHGLDFSPARRWAANTGYPKHLTEDQLLGPGAVAIHVEAAEMSAMRLMLRATLRIERDGMLDGIGGWFVATLAPGVELTNAPTVPARLTRRNVALPLERPVAVRRGDTLDVQMQVRPADVLLTWRGVVRTPAGETRFSHSTFDGMLLTADDLRRLRPDRAPRLTERGRARLSVLELCDGERPLAAVEREVLARHPSLFRSATEAAVFVSEVVSRYAE